MTREQVLAEIEKAIDSPDGGNYMMGTIAYHQIGDLSMPMEDIFHYSKENDDFYIGAWIEGIGAFNVLFPKSTSRRLTPEEVKKYSKNYYAINDQPAYKLTDLK